MEVVEPMVEEFLSDTNDSSAHEDGPIENDLPDKDDPKYHDEDDDGGGDDDEEDEGSQSSDDGGALIELATSKDMADAKGDIRRRQQCTECEKEYSKRKYLQTHMLREHNLELPKVKRGRTAFVLQPTEDNPRPYKCDLCIKEYTQLRHLTRHKRMHLRTFCDFCQQSFTFYEDHMRKEHNVELPRPFECDMCGRSFRVKSTFQAHMKIHREENRVFNCTLCSKAFFQATDLRKHIKSHSNVRPIICDVCGDSFKSAETLKCHMRRHTGDRPYPCKICPRAFTTSNSLMIHQRTHTNEKPYECEVCQKRFSDLSTLLVHKRLHTGDSPYCCHICGRRTKQASNLRSHYRHLHKMNDISGRQVRLNAKIFERFTQQEIDQHLRENGDLIALLSQGLDAYNNEQREKSKMTEQLIETMRAPLRPIKKDKDAKEEEAKPSSVKNESKEINRKVSDACDDQIIASNETRMGISTNATIAVPTKATQMSYLVKQEPPIDTYDDCPIGNDNKMEIEKKPAMATDTSDQIESVFIVEDTDPVGDADFNVPVAVKEEFEDDQMDCWMDGGGHFDEISNVENETTKFEFSAKIESIEHINEKSKKLKKPKKEKPTKNVKRKKKPKGPSRTLVTCSLCQKRVHSDKLNVHQVECHSVVERPFECFHCHKQFKKYKHVSYHQRTHYSDERNFICHMCGDAFVMNAELTKHIFNRHNDIRPFKCEHCEKMFKNRNALKVHMRSHTGEKAFKCSVCFESFSANSSLRLHFRRHTNEKPYVCSFCDKRFADCSTHRQHERIHTGEKPYQCHLCDRRTSQAGNLKSHYRHYHKLVVKNVKMENNKRF